MLLDLKKVKVTPTERKILEQEMSNWDSLHNALHLRGGADVGLAEKMLKVEVERKDRERPSMVTRLLGLYHSAARVQNTRHVQQLLSQRGGK